MRTNSSKFKESFGWLTPKCIGVDVSDFSIEVAQLKKKGKTYVLKKKARIPVPNGVFEAGKIIDQEKMVEILKKLKEVLRKRGIKNKNVIASLPEPKVLLKTIHLPKNLRDKEKTEKIESRLAELFPYDPEELYWDYEVVKEGSDSDKAIVVAVEGEVSRDYKDVFMRAGFRPQVLDTESLSIARALSERLDKEQACLVVDSGARTTNLNIFDINGVQVTGLVNIAGNDFTSSISQILKITTKEAEKLKRRAGVNARKKTGQILIKSWSQIIDEIKRIISYYEEKHNDKVVKIILCGGSSLLPGLPDFLHKKIGLKVEYAAMNIPVQDKMITMFMINAIGLAMRGVSKNPKKGINLLS